MRTIENIKKLIISSLLFISLSPPLFAEIRTFGVVDCGQWLNDKTPSRKTWVLGYLTGVNAMHNATTDKNPLGKINSADQIYVWIDNYCQKNPLKSVDDAAANLFFELLKK
jgi:hypothetical protein